MTDCIRTDLELEGVGVRPPAKVAVPHSAVVDVLLSEGSRGCEASVVDQRGAPAFWRAVGGHGHQHHLTWTEEEVEVVSGFLLVDKHSDVKRTLRRMNKD